MFQHLATSTSPMMPSRSSLTASIIIAGAADLACRAARARLFRCGRFDQQPAFANVVRDRLLDVHVLAGVAGQDRGRRMPMVGRGDDHGVDRLVVENSSAGRPPPGSSSTPSVLQPPSPARLHRHRRRRPLRRSGVFLNSPATCVPAAAAADQADARACRWPIERVPMRCNRQAQRRLPRRFQETRDEWECGHGLARERGCGQYENYFLPTIDAKASAPAWAIMPSCWAVTPLMPIAPIISPSTASGTPPSSGTAPGRADQRVAAARPRPLQRPSRAA